MMHELGRVRSPAVVAGALAMVGVLDKFCAEVMGELLLPWLARVANDWLWWNDMAEVGFMEKMRGRDVVRGGFYTDAFLAGEACR
jgi:hypothetical protein